VSTGRREGVIRNAHRLHHRTSRPKSIPGMHVYTTAPYEPTAMKRLMGCTTPTKAARAVRLGGPMSSSSLPNLAMALRAGSTLLLHQRLDPFLWARYAKSNCSAHLDICSGSSTRNREKDSALALSRHSRRPSSRTTGMTALGARFARFGWSGDEQQRSTRGGATSAPCTRTAGVEV